MALSGEHTFFSLVHSSNLSQQHKDAFLEWAKQTSAHIGSAPSKRSLSALLTSIPVPDETTYLPLVALSFLLSQYKEKFPAFDIIRRYDELWQSSPEPVKAGHDEKAQTVLQGVMSQVMESTGSVSSLISPISHHPALIDPYSSISMSHEKLSIFIQNFSLPIHSPKTKAKPVVVIALSNGCLLGVTVLAVASCYTAAPLNIAGGAEQFRSDAELARPQCILVQETDLEKLGLLDPWVEEAGIEVLVVLPNADLTFGVRPLKLSSTTPILAKPTPNVGDDFAFILFTSGTSGTKKVVPVTTFNLLRGVVNVVDSWGLTGGDSCVNMMPLNHVGGLVRNLFAPVLSGGSTILCPAFDPNLFWDVLEDGRGTWYYASPTMHMAILAEGGMRPDALKKCRLRLVCNAAGGLLPVLAHRLRDVFHCTVLPSYGMTECMPISTPPLGYTLDRTGTSGIACGPEIAILDDDENHVAVGDVGRINVRGGATFHGYLKGDVLDKSVFNKNGWFDTGDLGSFDTEGYLYLTGRGKEVINRGGELISPFEVEEAITIASQTPESPLFGRIKNVMAFSAPHEMLQEVVGVALVTAPSAPRPDVRTIHAALKTSLHSPKWPIVIVYTDGLPTSNNKTMRIKYSERLDMKTIDNDTSLVDRHFEAVCPPLNSGLGVKIACTPCKNDLELVNREVEKLISIHLDVFVGIGKHDGTPEVFFAPKSDTPSDFSPEEIINTLKNDLESSLDGFLYPSSFTYFDSQFPRLKSGLVDSEELDKMLSNLKQAQNTEASSETEQKVRKAFGEALGFDDAEISSDSDFFEIGGDSLSAGRLLSILRRDMQVRITVDQVFVSSKVSDICTLVDQILLANSAQADQGAAPLIGCTKTYSSTNPLVMLIHLSPIMLFYPMKMGLQWCILMYSLSTIEDFWSEPDIAARFVALVAAMFISRFVTQLVAPICGIAFKWVVIGKYVAGMYPMWGPYHTRWWLVQKVLMICGKGVYRHLDSTRLLYYRLLGAKIGYNVTIEQGTLLGEYDLLDIGDNVHLDQCIVRPFAAERNTSMYLGQITIGKNSHVGLKSHVAAGSTLPEDTYIGPNSSSYEMDDGLNADRSRVPVKTHVLVQFCIIFPIQVFVAFVAALPWMGGLYGIVLEAPVKSPDNVRTVIEWWATPHRIAYHYFALAMNGVVRPFVWIVLILIFKKIMNVFLGVARAIPASERTQKDHLRTALLKALIPNGNIHSVTRLFGSHYSFTSVLVRALGGKVGKRVYWPGTGPSIQDFDLVEIGDDVVFGSRSHIITSDAFGSEHVRVGAGAMVADRVVITPGAVIGDSTVLGSGAFLKRNQYCAPSSIWVGNRKGSAICLSGTPPTEEKKQIPSDEKKTSNDSVSSIPASPPPEYPGTIPFEIAFEKETSPYSPSSSSTSKTASVYRTSVSDKEYYPHPSTSNFKTPFVSQNECYSQPSGNTSKTASFSEKEVSPKVVESMAGSIINTPVNDTITPFGRAYYEGKADYHVLGPVSIFLYSMFITVFVSVYWNVGTVTTVIMSHIFHHTRQFHKSRLRPLKIYAVNVALLSCMITGLSILSLAIVILAKWVIIGRRKKGHYDWDKSSYCQRWQLFLSAEAIRRRCFGGYGVLGMLTGTHFVVLYFRCLGAKIGKDCSLFSGGRPSLMFTEPDLLTLGDRVVTDDSSLVCHINSRGNFSLNELSVGDRSVLRSGSRLLSGAKMGTDTVLLEHTLIMAGDEADDGTVFQGWPADVYRGDRLAIRTSREQ